MGEAGGINQSLKPGDIVLCTKALRDEGTSHHYIKSSKYAYPDSKLTSDISKGMRRENTEFLRGATWSTDAPYLETVEEVRKYSSSKIYTVDMEASALFAIAQRRGIAAAAVFLVSDVLRLDSEYSGFAHESESYLKGFASMTAVIRAFASQR